MLPRLLSGMLILALSACALVHPHFEQPTVRVVALRWRGGNLLQQDFAIKLNVQNPNARDLPIRELTFALKVEGADFATGHSEQAFAVPALGAADFDMDVSANLAFAVLKLADTGRRRGALAYELTGSARVGLPFARRLAFHQDGSVPLNELIKYMN